QERQSGTLALQRLEMGGQRNDADSGIGVWDKGIRVNAFLPSATMTPALRSWSENSPEEFRSVTEGIPMKRVSSPEEQAAAAVWLCSPESSYITGTLLNVDGGDCILGKQ